MSDTANAIADCDGSYIQWSKKFELGIPVIDAQHRHLVALCDRLHRAIMQNTADSGLKWEDSLAAALRECTEYVQTHFRDEELLMQAAGYADFAAHKAKHAAFTLKVIETAKGFSSVSVTAALQFVKFLYEWVLTHIAHEDTLYRKCIMDYCEQRKGKMSNQ